MSRQQRYGILCAIHIFKMFSLHRWHFHQFYVIFAAILTNQLGLHSVFFFSSFILFEMSVCTTMLLALVVSALILFAFLIGDRLGFCTKFHVFYSHNSQSAILHPTHTHPHTERVYLHFNLMFGTKTPTSAFYSSLQLYA